MLNPFPDLLTYSHFAPLLLRLAASAAFAYVAYMQWKRRDELATLRLPLAGSSGAWWVWLMALVAAALSLGLLLGYYTQWAAIFGALLSLKSVFFAKRYPRAIPLCRAEYMLLFSICLSLLLSGAGAPAFDLPL